MKSKEIKEEYETVTREELIKRIVNENLEHNYYLNIMKSDTYEKMLEKLSLCFTREPVFIAGSKIYYDSPFHYENDLDGFGFDEMMQDISPNQIVILENLSHLSSVKLLKMLTQFRCWNIGLYIIDFEEEGFIEIDINSLLIHIFEETDPSSSTFCIDFTKLSKKYYDSKI